MHDSRDLDAKKGPPWQRLREKHAFRANAAREAPFSCNQRKENTWRANLATAAKATSKIGTTNQ